jgi:hypothetical protein
MRDRAPYRLVCHCCRLHAAHDHHSTLGGENRVQQKVNITVKHAPKCPASLKRPQEWKLYTIKMPNRATFYLTKKPPTSLVVRRFHNAHSVMGSIPAEGTFSFSFDFSSNCFACQTSCQPNLQNQPVEAYMSFTQLTATRRGIDRHSAVLKLVVALARYSSKDERLGMPC